nr:MAG TPA: hypothetical protein [Caudoviricetes sp.]
MISDELFHQALPDTSKHLLFHHLYLLKLTHEQFCPFLFSFLLFLFCFKKIIKFNLEQFAQLFCFQCCEFS